METQKLDEVLNTEDLPYSLFVGVIFRGQEQPSSRRQKTQMEKAKNLYSLDHSMDDWRTKAYRAIFHACPD